MWASRILIVSFALCSISGIAQGPVAKDGEPLKSISIDEDYIIKSRVFFSLIPNSTIDGFVLLFTCSKSDWGTGNYIMEPSILTFNAGKWTRFHVPASTYEWEWAGRSMDGRYVWGILDHVPEGQAHELMFVISDDFGRTWKVGRSFKKYRYTSYFKDFRMDKNGKGKIIIWYPDDDIGVPEIETEVGYHSYSTKNWGRTWTDELSYEPDYVEHAMGDHRMPWEKESVGESMESTKRRYEHHLWVEERRRKKQAQKESELNETKVP